MPSLHAGCPVMSVDGPFAAATIDVDGAIRLRMAPKLSQAALLDDSVCTAVAAPVVVGTMLFAAARARRKESCGRSRRR